MQIRKTKPAAKAARPLQVAPSGAHRCSKKPAPLHVEHTAAGPDAIASTLDAIRAEIAALRASLDLALGLMEELGGASAHATKAMREVRGKRTAPPRPPRTLLLYGVKAIAEHLGLTRPQAQHRVDEGSIPTFRIGGTICADTRTLDNWLTAARKAVAK